MTALLALAAALILPHIPGVYHGPGCAGHPQRPSSSYTSTLKVHQLAELGYTDRNPSDYEEDHLVSLSLGGDPKSVLNLWPQPWWQASRDDRIEFDLYRRACLHIGRPLEIREAVRWEKVWKRRHG